MTNVRDVLEDTFDLFLYGGEPDAIEALLCGAELELRSAVLKDLLKETEKELRK